MMDSNKAFSRPLKAAEQLGELAEDRHRFLDKRVLLTGETSILATTNGADCFLDSLMLAVRICSDVSVYLPSDCRRLIEQSKSVAEHTAFFRSVTFRQQVDDFHEFDSILSVGSKCHPELPWTSINSNGWIARVTSRDIDLPSACNQTNPVGSLAAACLGVGEVFKRLVRLRPERGQLLNGFAFSLRTLE